MSEYLSPLELWKDFDPKLEDPDINIIRQYSEGEISVREFYFTAWRASDGLVRIFAKFCYNPELLKEKFFGKAPVVMILGGLRTGASDEIQDYIQEKMPGVSTLIIDYYGATPLKSRYTLYPESLSFANFYQNCGSLDIVKGSPKDTPWYVWAAIARKSITMLCGLPEVNPDRIGIIGVKTGGKLAWILAAIDERVKTAVSLFNSGWQGYPPLYQKNKQSVNTEQPSEERLVYLAALSTQSYAPFVNSPIFAFIATNDYEKTFDRSFDTFARVKDGIDAALCVETHTDKEIRYEHRDLVKVFLGKYLLGKDVRIFAPPKLNLRQSGGKLYIDLKVDEPEELAFVTIYQATETEDPSARNWNICSHESLGDGEYLAVGQVLDPQEYFFCYALVTYKNKTVQASNFCAVIPAKIGVMTPNKSASRLILDTTSQIRGFTVANANKLFHQTGELIVKKGPLDLLGISAGIGDLATYMVGDPAYKAYDDDRLQIGYYSPEEQEITLTVRAKEEDSVKEYFCTFSASGGENWNKQTLAPSDFKSQDLAFLESFENVFFISFSAPKTLLINNLLWV